MFWVCERKEVRKREKEREKREQKKKGEKEKNKREKRPCFPSTAGQQIRVLIGFSPCL